MAMKLIILKLAGLLHYFAISKLKCGITCTMELFALDFPFVFNFQCVNFINALIIALM